MVIIALSVVRAWILSLRAGVAEMMLQRSWEAQAASVRSDPRMAGCQRHYRPCI
jgi:hypothetical protein